MPQKVVFENAPAYSAPLPADMIYHQKRGAFRAAVHRSLETKVGLIKQQRQHQILGELADISATGCKARFVGDLRNQVTPESCTNKASSNCPMQVASA